MNTTKVIEHIVSWLNNYVENAKMNGFIVGVSGGIDSAVVSTLAAKTGKPTLVLEMPIHQEENQVHRSSQHIAWLERNFPNVSSKKIDLTSTFDEMKESFSISDATEHTINLSLANTRSRLRMTTLYFFGGIHGYLVTGTGNKVEDFGVGFFTKYGDGGVDISPIADLLKTQVYELAKELGIVESIQKAVPTDGLWGDNRSDEDQMGATYPELEWAMSVYKDKVPNDFSGRQKEVLEIFNRLNKATQHKINPIPVCEIPEEFL
ncbi:MAG: NAD(+) synthase [Flavobacteriales bacterium]|nr:NAD(+) synthase [Flavobacteriales bacterium]